VHELNNNYPSHKPDLYRLLQSQLAALMEGENHPLPNLANASALLKDALTDINWVGFYLMTAGDLLLGPFQGKPACIRIPVGKGVCGAAVKENKTQLVMDVHKFPGHIACDSASNSEIVVPIWTGGKIVGVLDIDSPCYSRFDEQDQQGLEELMQLLAGGCQWDRF
jgi:L-methionine (R)-S-oxide reductase